VFENRLLRIIFEPRRAEVTGSWRKLQSYEIHNFYCSQSIISKTTPRRMRRAGQVAHMDR
jgi:hypothetical protein